MTNSLLVAEIDPDAITHNLRLLRGFTPAGCRVCAAVKADAYGHGIGIVIPALERAGVEMLGVATTAEALELRDAGCTLPILLFGAELSGRPTTEAPDIAREMIARDVRVTVTTLRDLDVLAQAAASLGKAACVHVKLDSGMSRMGVDEKTAAALVSAIGGCEGLTLDGVYTHFATADDDKAFARHQLDRFLAFVRRLEADGQRPAIVHAANSAATIDLPGSQLDMIRPGISVYGYHTSPAMANKPDLRPALRVVTALTLVKPIPSGSCVGYGCTFRASRDMVVGLVPIGYADGYDRRLSNIGSMRVAGQHVPVVGRVSMDQTVVDLTDLWQKGTEPNAGARVIVVDNDRAAPNSVEALAEMLGTIPYEITTRLGRRVQRIAASGNAANEGQADSER